jgi:predicted RNA-binding Zn-ribbon protein involved in translation (DUF1610 family)
MKTYTDEKEITFMTEIILFDENETTWYCPRCDSENHGDGSTCDNCGVRLV